MVLPAAMYAAIDGRRFLHTFRYPTRVCHHSRWIGVDGGTGPWSAQNRMNNQVNANHDDDDDGGC